MEQLRNKISLYGLDFWKYMFGQFISIIGDVCGHIAFTWWILEQKNGTEAIAAVMAPAMFFRIFLMPLVGPLGDKFSRKKILAISEALRGIVTAVLALLIILNHYHLPILIFLFSLLSVGTALYYSASTSIIPQLVKPQMIEPSIQLSQGITASGNVIGGVVGGSLVAFLGVKETYILDSLSFFLATIVILRIKSSTLPQKNQTQNSSIKQWSLDLKEGFQVVYRVKILFSWALLAMLMNFVVAPLSIALPALIKEAKNLPAWCLGWAEMSAGVGAVVGSYLVAKSLKQFSRANLIYWSIFGLGLSCALLPLGDNVYFIMASMFMIAVFGMLCNVPASTQIMIATPDHYRSRVSAILSFMCQGINPISIAIIGILMAEIGIETTILGMGLILSLLALCSPFVPDFFHFFNSQEDEVKDFFESRYRLSQFKI
jgi:MFS family permease